MELGPRDFAHVNKFSILASDEDESLGVCCTSEHTSRIQYQQRKCGAERVDECRRGDERVDECITAPETTFSSQRGSGPSKSSAASGGDSRGVHHVSGLGWRRLSAIMDSGSAECVAPESLAKNVPLMETEVTSGTDVPHCRWGRHQEQR